MGGRDLLKGREGLQGALKGTFSEDAPEGMQWGLSQQRLQGPTHPSMQPLDCVAAPTSSHSHQVIVISDDSDDSVVAALNDIEDTDGSVYEWSSDQDDDSETSSDISASSSTISLVPLSMLSTKRLSSAMTLVSRVVSINK